ncbi:Protein kinase domain [Dillenia turbinata]|uniref:Protein kinase domain n=1 Tax=Dillenia turbinata TaxID=194707 RepID=A0AAN8UG02_9MAGN
MGCVSSKQEAGTPKKPAFDQSEIVRDYGSGIAIPISKNKDVNGDFDKNKEDQGNNKQNHKSRGGGNEVKEAKKGGSKRFSLSVRIGNYHDVEADEVAAGWPAWLCAVAGEAIKGWVPLRPDSFEKLEKVGQGTYSSVYRARDVKTGKIVALKKVRFDYFEPESVRFMSREITILRRLDHPNIMKLEGIITSQVSSNIYLVFEYMEHDLSGLLSVPEIKFTESQVKCYMQQLLAGIEHCHSRGIMHRDIKSSNILLNNEGVLKIADFGLANYFTSRNKRPLTSRVVTLWYRPPELLLGSTNYGATVDLWSVGCVFAEILFGKPILKGRTEVEQLHKIFKLCGSPSEEYWKSSKLPQTTVFKPQHTYESSLRERCKELPRTAINLIETLLSVEPHKRGTASAALKSEFFTTRPFACDPSTLPKYPPNKEIDAKIRDEARRKKAGLRGREPMVQRRPRKSHKASQDPGSVSDLAPVEVPASQLPRRNSNIPRVNGGSLCREPLKSSFDDSASEVSQLSSVTQLSMATHLSNASQADFLFSAPLQAPAPSNFSWAKKRLEDSTTYRPHGRINPRGQAENSADLTGHENGDNLSRLRYQSRDSDSYESAMQAMRKQRKYDRPESFDASDVYGSKGISPPPLSQEEDVDPRRDSDSKDGEDTSAL